MNEKLTASKMRNLIDCLALDFYNQDSQLRSAVRGQESLPPSPTVYLLTAPDQRILYVGQSSSLSRRSLAHERTPHISCLGHDRYNWFDPGLESLSDRLALETILICTARPQANAAILLRLVMGRFVEIRWKRKGRRR